MQQNKLVYYTQPLCVEFNYNWLCPGSTLAQELTRNPKIEGSNPTTVIGRVKMSKTFELSK